MFWNDSWASRMCTFRSHSDLLIRLVISVTEVELICFCICYLSFLFNRPIKKLPVWEHQQLFRYITCWFGSETKIQLLSNCISVSIAIDKLLTRCHHCAEFGAVFWVDKSIHLWRCRFIYRDFIGYARRPFRLMDLCQKKLSLKSRRS